MRYRTEWSALVSFTVARSGQPPVSAAPAASNAQPLLTPMNQPPNAPKSADPLSLRDRVIRSRTDREWLVAASGAALGLTLTSKLLQKLEELRASTFWCPDCRELHRVEAPKPATEDSRG